MRLIDTLLLRDWRPRPRVVVPASDVERSAVPCIDVHNHLGRWLHPDGDWLVRDPAALVAMMDALGVESIVNLDGRWGAELGANLDRYDRAFPGRFHTFCHLDWRALHRPGADVALRRQLEEAARRGARGVKIWKDLGLSVRDGSGRLVLPDDDRILPALVAAGGHGLPVLIHTADPVAFFDPMDRFNERIEELVEHPDWWFGGAGTPAFDVLLGALERMVAAVPGTTVIGAHVGCHAEDLGRVAAMLAAHSNFHVEIGGRIAELGRTPRAFRRLVLAHPDRVLFGTDAYPPTAADYRSAFRFLETDDEAFDYAPGEPVPPQGRWQVSAADLPAEVLPAVYRDNARRLLHL